MSRQLDLVVQGVLGTHPSVIRTASGRAFCHFRLATTPSFRTDAGWRDGPTMWFTAKAWGGLAENLGHSLRKGDPVVLVGRLGQESWTGERGEQVDNVLTVACGGHDLTRGESRFMRISQASGSAASADPAHSASTADEADDAAGAASDAAGAASAAEPGSPNPALPPLPDAHWQSPEPAEAAPPPTDGASPQDSSDYVLVGSAAS